MLSPDPQLAVEYGLFSVKQAMGAGISRGELDRGLRRGRWERVEHGILRETGRQPRQGDDLLCAVLRAGPGAVAAFESAAEVHGWDLSSKPAKPQLIVPRGRTRSLAEYTYRAEICSEDVVLHGVLPLTTPVRTSLDIAATGSLDHSVVVLDSALRAGSVSIEELERTFEMSRRHGVRTARKALDLVDPRSGSIPESQARLLFWHAGVPAPISQYEIYEDGVFIARADFAWPWARVVAEIDGFRYHSATGDFQRDRERQNAMVLARWTVLRFTPTDICSAGALAVSQLCSALGLPMPMKKAHSSL